MIQSGWRVIALETYEEDRALKLVQRVAESTKREVVRWTSAERPCEPPGFGMEIDDPPANYAEFYEWVLAKIG